MEKDLLTSLESRGYRASMTSVQHLDELEEILGATHRQGLLDEEFYQSYLTGFSFCLPEELPQACSLIAVAVPQRQTRFIFNWEGKQIAAFTPPTYLHAGRIDEQMEKTLKGLLEPGGYHSGAGGLAQEVAGHTHRISHLRQEQHHLHPRHGKLLSPGRLLLRSAL